MVYELLNRRPDPNVSDLVLTDRIRSSLGPLEKRLDAPHVHVMVEDHVAPLHGSVPTRADADQLEQAVVAVFGVRGVESYLHVGLGASDTRPSVGRQTAGSPAERWDRRDDMVDHALSTDLYELNMAAGLPHCLADLQSFAFTDGYLDWLRRPGFDPTAIKR